MVEPGLKTEVAQRAAKSGGAKGATKGGQAERASLFLSVITPKRTLDLEFRSVRCM